MNKTDFKKITDDLSDDEREALAGFVDRAKRQVKDKAYQARVRAISNAEREGRKARERARFG